MQSCRIKTDLRQEHSTQSTSGWQSTSTKLEIVLMVHYPPYTACTVYDPLTGYGSVFSHETPREKVGIVWSHWVQIPWDKLKEFSCSLLYEAPLWYRQKSAGSQSQICSFCLMSGLRESKQCKKYCKLHTNRIMKMKSLHLVRFRFQLSVAPLHFVHFDFILRWWQSPRVHSTQKHHKNVAPPVSG